MANVSVLLSLLLISATIYLTKSEEVKLYTDKYDHVNYDEILSNDRLRNQYYNCAMGTSRCLSDDATFFKGKTKFYTKTNFFRKINSVQI